MEGQVVSAWTGQNAANAAQQRTRTSNTCDGCALRRVRCDARRPCIECQKRDLPCTTLRARRKRGPKGPRQTTGDKVRKFQHQLQDVGSRDDKDVAAQPTALASPGESPTPRQIACQRPPIGPSPSYRHEPLWAYCRFLDVFRSRLSSVWPVVSCDSLIRRLVGGKDDGQTDDEAWALAAAVCAGVIAQLRLPEHRRETDRACTRPASATASSEPPPSSHGFADDAEHFRRRYNYREHISVASLLTSFFLHIYCANTSDLLRTAGFHLRNSLTQVHMLGLHRTDTYAGLSNDERELRLRVYWLLFVSERTYCVQHGLPPILRPISQRPNPGPPPCPSGEPDADTGNPRHPVDKASVGDRGHAPIASFVHLTRLFAFLDGDLIEPPSTTVTLAPPETAANDPTRHRVAVFQSDLDPAAEQEAGDAAWALEETQRVDIFVTRSWIRILLWEYSVRRFAMSCSSDDQAFSMLLPALVAHSTLGFFSTVSAESICAHGYGMELKAFRIADCLLDVLACGGGGRSAGPSSADSMLVGSRDALHALEMVLSTVGGAQSPFLDRLRHRMAEVQLPFAASNPDSLRLLPWTEEDPVPPPHWDAAGDEAAAEEEAGAGCSDQSESSSPDMWDNGMAHPAVASVLDLGEHTARQPVFLDSYGTIVSGQSTLA